MNRNLLPALLAVAMMAPCAVKAAAPTPADEVDPLIDSHKSRWIFFASACRPFGMVSLSPDTQPDGDWGAGYLYGEKYIHGFSHLHDWQLAGVPLMPVVGEMKGAQGSGVYKSAFSHSDEVVKAGYHKVVLSDYGVTAEVTATKRVGFHRYQFPAGEKAYVLLDIGAKLGPTTMEDARIRRSAKNEVAGFATMAPTPRRPRPSTVYFVAVFDHDFEEFGGWVKGAGKTRQVIPGVQEVSGPESGGFVRFKFAQPGKVLAKVAISFVSEEQARLNLTHELPGWDFDGAVNAARTEWNEWLGKVKVEGGTRAERVKFQTDLFHALVGRHAYSDVDGQYTDNTQATPRRRQVPLDAEGRVTRDTFTSDAFWGSQWNLNILWSMAYPRLMRDQLASLVDYYHNGGMIARGPAGGNYTFVMIGDQAIPLIAAAYNKGIRDFDVDAAYEGSVKNAHVGGIRDHAGYETGPNATGGGMKYYEERGYVPLGVPGKGMHREGAAMTMEYAYSDWCLSEFARALGKKDDAEKYAKRSRNWRNLFDASIGWVRPKNMDGTWWKDYTPTCEGSNCKGFVEANGAIYTYFVPQDVPGLIEALGGTEKFVEKLNKQMEMAAKDRFITPHGKHGGNWIDYENEPSGHIAHLFSHAGAPWLTQYWVRRVKKEVFGDATPEGGYNGDEDQGQMGGLGVLMAIGLFDVTGGAGMAPRYEITSPIFDKVTIELDPRYYKGKTFTIVTKGNKPANVYIQSAKLNGKPIVNRYWITHEEFTAGGTLEIELGAAPNKKWGVVK